jgi:transcriptional regulator with XRE-family HTH domain
MTNAQQLGDRIIAYRERLGLTQQELAQNSNVDASLLAAVEKGEAYPALGILVRLSRALGQRVGTFTDDHTSPDPLIVRAVDRDPGSRQHLGGVDTGIRYFPLGRGKADRHMEPMYLEIGPDEPDLPTSHEGEELLIVISGQLEIRYGKQVHLLGPGDSAYYNSVVPHCVRAGGGQWATAYAVIYQPS